MFVGIAWSIYKKFCLPNVNTNVDFTVIKFTSIDYYLECYMDLHFLAAT
jgi:hypothetical protein